MTTTAADDVAGLAIDDAAWSSAWRDRGLVDKVVLSGGLILTAVWLPAWPGSVMVALAVLFLGVFSAGTSPRVLVRAMRAPVTFIAIGAVSVAITVTASPTWSIDITRESLQRAGGVAAHAVAGTLAVLLLALTTPMADLLTGLRRLRVPAACVEVAALMYRLLFILLDTTQQVRISQQARLGYSTPRKSLRSAGALTGIVLTRAWDRARRLEQGMAGRGYTDTLHTLDAPASTSPRFVAATLAGLVTLVLAALELGSLT